MRYCTPLLAVVVFVCAGASVSARSFKVTGSTGADIQKTIDSAAAYGGGTVVVSAGTYSIASIRLYSNINLHLRKGAVLLGSTKSGDYDTFPQQICTINPEKSGKVLLYAYDSENIALTGEGTIDGSGPSFFDIDPDSEGPYPKPAVQRPLMVKFVCCNGVRIEGVTLKDSPCWTVLLRLCERVEVKGITITADQRMINNDGIVLQNFNAVVTDSAVPYKVRDCNGLVFKNVSLNGGRVPDGPVAAPSVVRDSG